MGAGRGVVYEISCLSDIYTAICSSSKITVIKKYSYENDFVVEGHCNTSSCIIGLQ